MRRLLLLLLLGLLGVGACTGRNVVHTAAAPRAAVGIDAPGAGAAPGPTVAAVATTPPPADAHVPAHPTGIGVVVLHSFNNTAAEPVEMGWSAASDRYGFVAIYPSRGTSWNAGLCCGAAAEQNRDDVSWLASVIEDARRRYHLSAVYLAGFSNGGMMAERLVAERPSVATRMVAWGSAPEMPRGGRWTGTTVLYTGQYDNTVPAAGGIRTIGATSTIIRPGATTGWWLTGGPMQWLVVPGLGHHPPADWADWAWRALIAPPGAAPRR